MKCGEPDPRIDRLYELLPVFYRMRDAERGGPLQALLRVISEQVNLVEDDITQLYDDWFVETAQDWAVPYLGDLIGYLPVPEAGDPAQGSLPRQRILVPRREVAHTIRARRRKGTLHLLEELARDVGGWPARAVELYRLLAWFQHVDHVRRNRGRTVDVRQFDALDRLDGPFDELAHSVDVRRIQSSRRQGWHNIPSVGLFVWRLRAYPVREAPAGLVEEAGPGSFTFSVLGNDAPLFTRPDPETDPTSIAGELNLPVPIRRRALEDALRTGRAATYCGVDRSFQIWAGSMEGDTAVREPVPAERLVVADLSGWEYRPRRGTVAVDPVLGRFAFPPGELPAGAWVSYHYGFSADIGGGGYHRPLHPLASDPDPRLFHQQVSRRGEVKSVERALELWQAVRAQKPWAVVEIADSEVYDEPLQVVLYKGEHLQIRAADRTRPVILLLDRQRNLPDALAVTSPEGESGGGCFTLDGVLVTGRPVHVEGALQRVTIRHSTLVPGWTLEPSCEPRRPTEPSLELYRTRARVRIEHSILGSIQVYQDEVKSDPTPIAIEDSIVDATRFDREALGAPNWPLAHATLTLRDSTVLGQVQTHAIELAENSIFMGEVRVARRQIGCVRFCYVPPGSRTPRRHRCQPDLVDAGVRAGPDWEGMSDEQRARTLEAERLRVRPQLDEARYGRPRYGRLSRASAQEIARGADDESEMGVFHDLYQPQRLISLRARLEEYTPARTDVDVVLAD
jgi:hypothetical protein